MVRIAETAGRDPGTSGYCRLVGDDRVGDLLSQTHAATIRGGMRLVRAIYDRLSNPAVARRVRQESLSMRLAGPTLLPEPLLVAMACDVPGPHADGVSRKVDMLVWAADEPTLYILAVTEADQWDTKKADGERDALYAAVRAFGRETRAEVRARVVSFYATDLDQVAAGFKNRFSRDALWTGRDLCSWLGVDFDAVAAAMAADAAANLSDLVLGLAAIPAVAAILAARGWTPPPGSP